MTAPHHRCETVIEFPAHDDVIKWKYFPRNWPFVRGIHRSPAGEFPAQRPVTRIFDVFFDLCLNKRSSKQSWGWWFETLSRPLWRHCNDRVCRRTTDVASICGNAISWNMNRTVRRIVAKNKAYWTTDTVICIYCWYLFRTKFIWTSYQF